jgi:murein DD-endopeptidase MepM/ murein hydrolase activator NlpD
MPPLLAALLICIPLALVTPPARAAPAAPAARFGWPVEPHSVVRRFDPPPRPWLAGHRGVDLAASPSVPVRAAGAGTVVFAGEVAGRGVVSIAHPAGCAPPMSR